MFQEKAGPENKEIKADRRESSGWVEETTTRQESIRKFLKTSLQIKREERARYDSLSELHLSGGSNDIIKGIANGTSQASRIDVLYEHDKPVQIHVLYATEGKGSNLDVYLKGKALEDFWSSGPQKAE